MTHERHVLIAGAGPVGVISALLLVKQGIPVTVFEAEADLTIDLRAGSFHPPSMEIMAPVGLTQKMHEVGIEVPLWQFRDLHDGIVSEIDLNLLKNDTPYPYRLHIEQHRATRMAYDLLKRNGLANVLFSHKLVGISQRTDGVEATVETPEGACRFEGAFLIGADGGRSTVRKLGKFQFPGFTWPELFVVTSTTYDFGKHGFTPNAYIADPDDWCAIFKMPGTEPGGLWGFAYGADPELGDQIVLSASEVETRMQRFVRKAEPYDILYKSTYRVHQRVCDTFRKGRVILAGDAAHINNPIGALGLNSGIQDAGNLCDKLGRVWRGEASDNLLDLYDRQRRAIANDIVQSMSIRNKERLQERDPAVRKKSRDEMRRIVEDPVRHYQYLLGTSMIASVRKAASIV